MNWFKDRLGGDVAVHGIWLSIGSHVAAEVAAVTGFDWALIDLEHGLGGEAEALRQIQVLSGTGTAPVVRVPASTSDLVGRALDFGAAGIMAPGVDTAEQAAAFVRALRYPPAGTRGLTASCRAAGYGTAAAAYFAAANQRLVGLAQIESAEAVANADAIAAVDGIDVLFIGHSDLSLALGCPGRLDAAPVLAAEAAVVAACRQHGKRAGLLLKAGASPTAYPERGFSVLALGSDIGCLRTGFAGLLATAREQEPPRR